MRPDPAPSPEGSVGPAWSDAGDWQAAARNEKHEAPRYQRDALLGRGGMGEVWSASDTVLGRQVAIKLPGPHPDAAARLSHEARLTARLEHPGIVSLYDGTFPEQGEPFYAMRLVRGRSLHDALQACGDLPSRLRLVRPLLAVAEAVAYAHDQGIVHCDLKPANIMLGAYGETQVLDWGLAREADRPAHVAGVAGTPGYMSPEQALGEPATRASDVWALGAILHEVLTGATPNLAVQSSYPLRAHGVPADLAAVAERALHPDPAQRYASALLFAAELNAWLDGRRTTAYRYSPRELMSRFLRTFRLPLGIAAALLLVLAATTLWFLTHLEAERDGAVRARMEADRALGSSLAEASLGALERRALAEADVLAQAALGRNEHPLARGVAAIVAAATPVLPLPQSGPTGCLQGWQSPTGSLCIRRDAAIWQPRPGSAVSLRAMVDAGVVLGGALLTSERGPAGHLVVLRTHTAEERGRVLLTLAEAPRLASSGEVATVLTGDRLWRIRADGSQDLMERPDSGSSWTAAAPWADGTVLAAQRGAAPQLYASGSTNPAERGGAAAVVDEPRIIAWRPDGKQVGWGSIHGELVVTDLTGMVVGRIASNLGQIRAMRWSPDGSMLAVAGERSGVTVLSAPDLQQLASLPLVDADAFDWDGARELWTLGHGVWRKWKLGELAAPRLAVSPGQGLTCVEPHPTRPWLATGSADGWVRVVDARTGRLVRSFRWTDGVIKRVTWSATGDRLAATDAQRGLLRVYRTADWEVETEQQQMSTRRIAFLQNDFLLVAPYSEGGVLFRRKGSAWEQVLGSQRGAVRDAAVSPDRRFGAVLSEQGEAWALLDSKSPGPLAWRQAPGGARSLAMGTAANTMLFATETQVVVERIGTRQHLSGCPERIQHVALSRDERWAAATSSEGSVCIWSLPDGKLRSAVAAHADQAVHAAFAPGDPWLYSAGWDGQVVRHNLASLLAPATTAEEAGKHWQVSPESALQSIHKAPDYIEKL